ncbi:unannotated protein [freshwater metagenome]|uniref:Unannotated protein n=1 Tax=freshwater metagenome TaxID=449393 RepID=A0A6J6KLC1_9ZZZZ
MGIPAGSVVYTLTRDEIDADVSIYEYLQLGIGRHFGVVLFFVSYTSQ